MFNLSSPNGSAGNGPTSWEGGNIGAPSQRAVDKELIHQADCIPITKIFSHYRVRLDEASKKAICPFPFHKGGHEGTASFYYYPKTNTFNCFGCGTGGGCCRFVGAMDSTSWEKAAHKILELFEGDGDDFLLLPDQGDVSERLTIMLEFSETVRVFRSKHKDERSFEFIENMCMVFDDINEKRDLSNDALKSVVQQLKENIECYH